MSARPLFYETRRDKPTGSVLDKRGRLRLYAVYSPETKGEKARGMEVLPLHIHGNDFEIGSANAAGRNFAATVVGHWFGTKTPHATLYDPFCAVYVASANTGSPLRITADHLDKHFSGRSE